MNFPQIFDPLEKKNDVARHNSSICYVGRIQNADVSSFNIRIMFFTSFKGNVVAI